MFLRLITPHFAGVSHAIGINEFILHTCTLPRSGALHSGIFQSLIIEADKEDLKIKCYTT